METLFWAFLGLGFVALVYSVAYRQGFDASRKRAEAIVEEFSFPVADLLARIDEEMDEASDRKSTSDDSDSDSSPQ